MNGLNYLLQTNLYLLLFMGFYVLVLRNETFFRQNRFFLNTSIFLSFLIPFINSDWFRDLFITQKVREAAIMPSQMMYDTIIVGISEEASSLTVADGIFWIYSAGAVILLIRFFIRLALLRSNLRAEKGTAFSFFNTLVVDKDMPKADTIINHEKVHMRQWHSADIIFIELAAIVNWFNPVMYLYKKEIRHIHEFIADEEAATLMQSKSDYALLLFSNTLGVDPLYLSNNFFNKSLLKRRIVMLHKNRSHSTGLWKYGFSAPLFILMLIVSAATVKSEEAMIRPVAENLLSPLDPETSNSIMSALELNKTAPELEKRSANTTVNSVRQDPEKSHSAPDYTALKKHLLRNLKYPPFARQNNITGYVTANFVVKNKKIVNMQVERGLQNDINDDVIRALSLFKEEIDAPDEKYYIAILYSLGVGTPAYDLPSIGGKKLFGQIVVTAMRPTPASDTKNVTPGANPSNSPGLEGPGASNNSIKDFGTLEVAPEFPGGQQGWERYLAANLKYPKQAKDNKIAGKVILAYIIEKDGSLSEIKVLKGVGGGLDEEAIRVLTDSPHWKPGILNGRPVRTAFTMPILFQLGADKEVTKTGEVKPD